MRKLLLLFLTICSVLVSTAQSNDADKNAALQLVSVHRTALGLSAADMNNLTVSSTQLDKSAGGIRYIYLQQTFKDIPVYNQIQVLAFKNNVPVSNTGGRIADFDQKVNVASGMPSVSAESAVMAALADKKLTATENAVAIKTTDNGRKIEFGKMGVSRENITAQLMWFPSADGSSFRLGWQVYFIPTTNSDMWLVQVDATNKTILGADNLTVYCNWDDPKHIFEFGINHNHANGNAKPGFGGSNLFDFKTPAKTTTTLSASPSLADNAIYRVIPLPYEAPSFMPGGPNTSATVNNPWTAATANAVTLKWHSTDATGTDYNYTRGNNVWAVQDRANNNTASQATSATSTTGLPNLSFDFVPDYTQEPIVTSPPNQQFNITNLFYYNNIIHDVLYAYGFDEVGGNFQFNNLGRGGNGNDHVWADAQDGSGTNNANFGTPADGGSGRMQMYLWTAPTPDRDGDVDNGIIAHEFGHGVSNRLFGGPLNVSCVGNGESQGEGISDYISLMFTHRWDTATLGGGAAGRGIGTYALNQPVTGVGIRSQRYSTDIAINSHVYQAVLPAAVHDRGEFWCEAAWEATWGIIRQSGSISPTIYWNGTSTAGNVVAMRIAIQAMKLAPCSSGFIDHRNGWFAADTLLYGGNYSCAMWEAFRKRGMGAFALQGSNQSSSDQTPDFTAWSYVRVTASAPTIPDGQNLTYTNTVATCSLIPITNLLLTDTLPANVTFVSATNGGTYNAGNRVVSWAINQGALSSQTYQFTVTVGPGAFPGNVVMRSSLFDVPAGTRRFNVAQVTTPITPVAAGCPTVGVQPASTQVCANTLATFSVTASAANAITYQWQLSTTGAGGPWTAVPNAAPYSGVATSTLTVNPAAIGLNNNQYRCFMTTVDCPAGVSSAPAVLSVVASSIGGTVNPAVTGVCGTTNTGTLTLSGHTGAVVRWEVSTVGAGGPWTTVANTTTTLTYTNIAQTTWYRAVVQVAGCAIANSSVAVINFQTSLNMFIVSDVNTTLCQGDPARLTVMEGFGTQVRSNPASITINDVGPATPYPANLTISGFPTSGVTVKSVTLTGLNHTWASDLDIVLQSPTGQNVMLLSDAGGSADFINNTMIFDDAAAGVFTAPPGANATATVKPTNTAGPDAFPAPGPASVPANPTLATFTGDFNGVWKLFINDQAAGDGGSITGGYSITFNGPAASVVTGGTFLWTPSAGLNSTTSNPVAASPAVTTTYTVSHNDGVGCTRQANITLTVNTRPTITSQPSNTSVCSGSIATFTANGTGTGAVLQWQVSTDNGVTYTNIANGAPYSGVTTGTLTINPTAVSMNGYRYRLSISGTCPPVAFSNGAILTVVALPNVVIAPTGPICGGVKNINGVALTATGANTYVWSPVTGLYTDATASTPYTGTNLATVYAAPAVTTVYTVTGTSTSTGCSKAVTIKVFYTPPAPSVTPNPVAMCLGDAAVRLISSSSVTTNVQFCSGPINIAIPEGNFPSPPAGAAVTTVAVSGIPANATISNVSVTSNITHAYVADVVMVLKAPNGQVFNLDAVGGYANNAGANFVNTTISPLGTTSLAAGTAPFTGTFKADAAGATFTFAGFTLAGGPVGYTPTTQTASNLYSVPNGNWTLAMYDAGAPDVGNITSWCLNITYYVGVPTTAAVWSPAAGLFNDAAATSPYIAGTEKDTVWTKPTPSGVYTYTATVRGLPDPNPSNTNPIAINDASPGSPYPSIISVSDYPTTGVSVKNVILKGVSHTWGDDVDILLQSPTGQNVVLMSDVGGTVAIPNATYTFDDAAPAMNATAANPTGSYHVTNNGATDTWVAPGPGSFTQAAPALSLFGSVANVNGDWKLFVVDDVAGDFGNISGGWEIVFTPPILGCLSPGRTVVVTVNQPITITTQPVNATVCTDKSTSFTVAAAGTTPTYQWQVSTDNANTFNNISNGGVYSGATTTTLTITAPPVSMNGYIYRCMVSGAAPCPPVPSANRVLTVNPLPTIVINASPYYNLLPTLSTTLFSTSSPAAATYTWLKNDVAVPGATASSLLRRVDDQGRYRLRVTDVNGCTNLSNMIIIGDSTSGRVFISPNPTTGQFVVRYNPAHNNVTPRGVIIYDARGKRILSQNFTLGIPFAPMPINLTNHGTGVYWVEVVDVNGDRLAVGRVEVVR